MSRYSRNILVDNVPHSLAWGFDRPLSEYFIQLFDESDTEDFRDDCVFSVSSITTTKAHPEFPSKMHWTNGELLQVFERYKDVIPHEHIDALTLDLPF